MITKEDIRNAGSVLDRYRSSKASIEKRVIENRRLWRRLTGSVADDKTDRETYIHTAWMFNMLAGRHADAVDAYPEAIISGREEGDAPKAKILSEILPLICEQNGYEELWSELWWSKLIDGTCITGVFFDNSLCRGLGDISLRPIDLLSLYWEPGITDIQKSRNVFSVESFLNEELYEKYPFLEGKLSGDKFSVYQSEYEDASGSEERSSVIDWYYKRRGKLHYCKFVGDEILYASENDRRFSERGWYDHGMYPFVFDSMYPYSKGICGFGYVDVCKNPQKYIDKLNSAVMRNALALSRARYFVRSDGGVNEKEFADVSNELIHVSSSALGEDSIRQIENHPLSAVYTNVLQMKIDEMKETVGNREFNQGGTYGGVVSGTAIAALQEAGSKISRDIISSSYRAFEKVNHLMIELIRQFYTVPRAFRILGKEGTQEFIHFDNSLLKRGDGGKIYGLESVLSEPIFDIKVFAQKASPFSREVRNERAMQFYKSGFFNPEMREQALAAIEMMDFDGREKIQKVIGGIQSHAEAPLPLSAPEKANVLYSAAEKYDAQRKKLRH